MVPTHESASSAPVNSRLRPLTRGTLIVPIPINGTSSLVVRLESAIQNATHGRVRDLKVEDLAECVVIRGSVLSHHTKQLALQAVMDHLPAGSFRALITVRPAETRRASVLLAKAY